MNPWWKGVAAVEVPLPCGDSVHRLRWHAGLLSALDHEDPEGERALAALGGERCACVDALDAWERHAADPRVLVIGTRGGGDVIPPPDADDTRRAGWFAGPQVIRRRQLNRAFAMGVGRAQARVAPAMIAGDDDTREAALKHVLSGALGRRLVATAAAALTERPDAAPAILYPALYGRVLATIAEWLGDAPALELTMIEPGEARSLTTDRTGGLIVRLPFSWLLDVWARELEVVWGRYVLAATERRPGEWELNTVAPAFRSQRMTVSLDAEG